MHRPGSISKPGTAPSNCSSRSRRKQPDPRCSASWADSPDSSRCATTIANLCWRRPATGWVPNWRSPRQWTSTTPSDWTWSRWRSTTWGGAGPLFLLDYIALGRIVPERLNAIVGGIAEGCIRAGCALLGGETAEHPGLIEPDHYDISATGVGVVEADDLLGPERVKPGDVIIAMGASGLHSNGYSLARKVLLEIDRGNLAGYVEEFGRTLGEELLEPTIIYAKDCLALAAETRVRTFCHVTGGGLAGNLERVIPNGLVADVDRGTWTPAPVFAMIAQRGRVSRAEMEKTFNMGVGMIAVVAPEDTDRALAILTARHLDCWVLGTINKGGKGGPRAKLVGQHPRF